MKLKTNYGKVVTGHKKATEAGSAAAAIVVSKQGCASAMPSNQEIKLLQESTSIEPKTEWS